MRWSSRFITLALAALLGAWLIPSAPLHAEADGQRLEETDRREEWREEEDRDEIDRLREREWERERLERLEEMREQRQRRLEEMRRKQEREHSQWKEKLERERRENEREQIFKEKRRQGHP
ncbi:hypothetical protein [Desulfohalovibrio reitneri]|uniref:hypothetical protein n=1 Tax=Desulfohalovibrio reitneri TaxID=1307759 RepID=UPI0004A71D35|nr:hypothetical protein [Desulfohalovibrio reitneri]